MADAKQIQFGHRLKRIDRSHRRLAQGYVTSVNHDGLIIARPARRTSATPLRGIFLCLSVLIVFKAFVYSQIGAAAYSDRLALLESGTIVEKLGAYVMFADPVTIWMAQQFNILF